MPRRRAMGSVLLILALVAILAFLALIIVTFFARAAPVRDIRHMGAEASRFAAGDALFSETFAILTNTTLSRGNRIEILTDGDALYPRLWADLSAATDLITWHVFWFKPGELADRLAEILTERAHAGVDVLFLYDQIGTLGTPEEYFERLRDAGVRVSAFRPVRWYSLYKAQQRMHTRTVVIDGVIGYTGGFGIGDEWIGDGRSPGEWRDTSVRIEGPVVNQLQASFVMSWSEAMAELLHGDRLFPPPAARDAGEVTAGLMYHAPSLGSTNAERFFLLSIAGASERLYITNAYFVPSKAFRRALCDAVARGVDVRVLTPGANTDRPSTYHAARDHYEELLESGVRLYHYRPTMVHAKTLVADGAWGAIGTLNMDNRSVVLNDEVAVVMRDERLGRRLEEIFLRDLEFADEMELAAVRERGWKPRLQERLWSPFSPFL